MTWLHQNAFHTTGPARNSSVVSPHIGHDKWILKQCCKFSVAWYNTILYCYASSRYDLWQNAINYCCERGNDPVICPAKQKLMPIWRELYCTTEPARLLFVELEYKHARFWHSLGPLWYYGNFFSGWPRSTSGLLEEQKYIFMCTHTHTYETCTGSLFLHEAPFTDMIWLWLGHGYVITSISGVDYSSIP